MPGTHLVSHFFCEGTLGYFACNGELEPRFGGFSKEMALSRLLHLIKTGRIREDEHPILERQIKDSGLPAKCNGVSFVNLDFNEPLG